MSVRKRTWKTAKGESKTAWIVDGTDLDGKRCITTFRTKAAADKHERTAKDEKEMGTYEARAKTLTFGDLLDDWIKECRRRNKIGDRMTGESLMQAEMCVDNHIRPALGKIKMRDLTQVRVQDYLNELVGKGYQGTQDKAAYVIRRTLKFANSRGYRRIVLITPLRVPPRKPHQPTPTLGQMRQLFDALDNGFYRARGYAHELRILSICLGAFAGMRLGEVAGLKWSDLDLVDGTIHVRHSYSRIDGLKDPKGRDQRDVPMHAMVRRALEPVGRRAGWPEDGFIFAANSDRSRLPSPGNIKEVYFYYAMREAGLLVPGTRRPVFTFHGLRRFFVSALARDGRSTAEIAKLVGHKRITTTYGYTKVFEDCTRSRDSVLNIGAEWLVPVQHGGDNKSQVTDLLMLPNKNSVSAE
jgi:integrase